MLQVKIIFSWSVSLLNSPSVVGIRCCTVIYWSSVVLYCRFFLYRLHWNHGDTELSPISLTKLYTDLVTTLLLRYLSTHCEYSQRKWVLKEFTDLQENANESFMSLAELAAKG